MEIEYVMLSLLVSLVCLTHLLVIAAWVFTCSQGGLQAERFDEFIPFQLGYDEKLMGFGRPT
jgi:hypothetical protein